MTGVPIAIVGIGCRFPGGVDDPDAFWRLVADGVDATGAIPRDRFDAERWFAAEPGTPGRMSTMRGGYLGDLKAFDAAFWALSPREAELLDPQQRLLLEIAWEAMEDARLDISALRGTRGGVFVGQWTSDFEALLAPHRDRLDFNATNGSGRYAASGRLSYLLGLRGPSLTLDTACSSSLAAVHLAMRSLQSHECDMALAGGVNVILRPDIHIAYSQGGMMAADGHCKFGDAARDGYVRSEGAGLVILKRLDDALAAGDPIRAVIRGGAINNDGDSSGSFGRPSAVGQEELLRSALADAGLTAGDIGYVEAHGTGTRAGDPTEIQAIAAVLGRPADPLPIGSIKTNIGHAEAAAGVAGLIKAVLAVQHAAIPPSLHMMTPNPAIPWDRNGCVIATTLSGWPATNAPRRAGVTSFGISGSNAHIIVEQAPEAGSSPTATGSALILPLSARSPGALRALAGAYAAAIAAAPQTALSDWCLSAATGRAALSHRAVFDARDRQDLLAALAAYAASAGVALADGVVEDALSPLAFVAPGQGSQWPGMAQDLLRDDADFAAAIDACDRIAARHGDWSIRAEIAAGGDAMLFAPERIDVLLPVLFALSIGYARVLGRLGILPAAVVGHSVGEIAAAHLAGAIDLEQAMAIVCRRGAVLIPAAGHGTMAMVDWPADRVEPYLNGYRDAVAIAGSNAPGSCTISGDAAALAALSATLAEAGALCRPIRIDMAAHSPQMDAPSEALAAAIAGITPTATALPFYSTVTGAVVPGDALNADYWRRNLRAPVLFGAAIGAMAAVGIGHFIELGPRPILLPSIAQAVPESTLIPCGERGATLPMPTLAAARLWAAGHAVAWTRVLAPGAIVPLPRYPWDRERLWPAWLGADEPHPAAGLSRPDGVATAWLYRLRWIDRAPGAPLAERRWAVTGGDPGFSAALAAAGLPMGDDPTDVLAIIDGDDAPRRPLAILRDTLTGPRRPRLWFATRGAQAIPEPSRVAVAQAAAWGAARVIGDEHPDLWGGLIDRDSGPENLAALVATLAGATVGDQIAVRGARGFALQLEPTALPAAPFAWRADASYLVIGGLGDVGLELAQAMAAGGARRLILTARTPLPPRREWTAAAIEPGTARRIAAVRALEAMGVAIHIVALDVRDGRAVADLLADLTAQGLPPVRGVIHAAGVLTTGLADAVAPADFDDVLAVKLDGAIMLDRLLPDLDLFVLVSSTSAVLVQAGQAAYAAANAGLDALAQDRLARGQPMLSIGWGVWDGAGIVADAAGIANVEEMRRRGFRGLDRSRARALLPWLCTTTGHVLVADIDWRSYRAARAGRDATLLDALTGTTTVTDAPRDRAGMDLLVRQALGQVLRLAPARIDANRSFGAMGLTSLMAVELRNRLEAALERPLPATLAFNYPTCTALVDWLTGDAAPPVAKATASSLPADAIAALSDEDALAALMGAGQ